MKLLPIGIGLGLAFLGFGCHPKISAPVTPGVVTSQVERWTAQASSVQTADAWSLPANAVDGDRTTRWTSDFSDPQWLMVDMGAARELAGLRISWEAAFARAYDILTSLDGKKWRTVYSTEEGNGGEELVLFRKHSARWIKVVGKKRGTTFGYSIWELAAEGPEAEPVFTASSSQGAHSPERLLDIDPAASWHSGGSVGEWLQVDYQKPRAFGRLLLKWGADYARVYDVAVSGDGKEWNTVYSQEEGTGGVARLYFESATGRYVRVACRGSGTGKGFSIQRIEVGMADDSITLQKFYEIAAERARGYYPRWMSGEQAFWTIVGVDSDEKESLFCEDGTIEHHKRGYTLMPLLYVDDRLVSRNDAAIRQSLEKNYLPIPSVHWAFQDLDMDITMMACGKAGESSTYTRYRIRNDRKESACGRLFLVLRPFQLYPPWQGEGEGENEDEGKGRGGLSYISSIRRDDGGVAISGRYRMGLPTPPDGFGTTAGKPALKSPYRDMLVDDLRRGVIPKGGDVDDPDRFASAVLQYDFDLEAGGTKDVYVAMPLHQADPVLTDRMDAKAVEEGFNRLLGEQTAYWEGKANPIKIRIPEPGFVETLKANIAYSFITKDGPSLQPGTWCYDKAWIRDGGIAAVALMRLGYMKEARAFIEWYTAYQRDTGEIPCVVDNKAKNPLWEGISEYDSQGEYLYTVLQYYRFTHDRAFLEGKLTNIVKALQFCEKLRESRVTPEYRDNPDTKLLYGLISKSYANHNYYDNLWTLKAWKDGIAIARILGRFDLVEWMEGQYRSLSDSVYTSMKGAMAKHRIDYIPEYPEGTHFWAASIAAGVSHCGELKNMPQPALEKTFDKYYAQFMDWLKPDGVYRFTPEEMPIVETFLYMGHKDRAIEFMRFMLAHQKPAAWYQWPEVVNSDERLPTIFGDMPHTWVSAQYISALTSFFLYEEGGTLVLAAGIPEEWVMAPGGTGIQGVYSHFGRLGLILQGEGDRVEVRIVGEVQPPDGMVLVSPLNRPLKSVRVNGVEWRDFTEHEVKLPRAPVDVLLNYGDDRP